MANIQRSEHKLGGLKGNHPLGALAGFGLLRACAEMPDIDDVRLNWSQSILTASLYIAPPLTDDELIARLVARQGGRSHDLEFAWAKDIRTDPKSFVKAAADEKTDERAQSFFAAFGCELIRDSKQNLKPTAFHMMSGNQRFLEKARELAKSLEPSKISPRKKHQNRSPEESFREALFGPWRYRDESHSFGWDPNTERLHALQAKSPTSESPRSVRAAVWLAVEALPLFPCAIVNNILRTRAFSYRDRITEFSWPLWRHPLSLDAVRSLVGLDDLTVETPDLKELRARGIFAVFRSQRASTGTQGYAILRAAHLCV